MYYAPENPIYDPYYNLYWYNYSARLNRIYEPDELPFWLAIGPITWEFIDRDAGRFPWPH